ncbi:zinc ribbon domain-containing protein [Tautonia sociabilis]|uniref:Zinc ribbon domain-containing protein n=1 Tax=Tautonia sociabilis TaxID=2080755 RepID=A0A432MGE2_9BACT|nr:zinc ribbon domain-containing protein [Tautonia sociabilis]RUL85735.1 hypothetical protein TsocGM_17845 [Tautonia sociabilis]
MSTPTSPGDALPSLWHHLLEAIARGPIAWSTPTELADALGLDEDETLDELASMDVAGLIEVWERPEGIVVTLSSLSAARLGVRLVAPDPLADPRWAGLGAPEPSRGRTSSEGKAAGAAGIEAIVDRQPGPDVEAERGEPTRRHDAGHPRGADGRGDLPRPTRLIGTGLVPWPGPQTSSTSRCPACGSRLLPPQAYCLYCDRWGLDEKTPTAPIDPRSLARQAERDRRRRQGRRDSQRSHRDDPARRPGSLPPGRRRRPG